MFKKNTKKKELKKKKIKFKSNQIKSNKKETKIGFVPEIKKKRF